MKYDKLSSAEKKALIKKEHVDGVMSISQMAKKYKTYGNKIRRDAIKLGLKVRNRSESQKTLLKAGIIQHPTLGKKRGDETKRKIGKTVTDTWENSTEEEKAGRSKMAKEQWKKRTPESLALMKDRAIKGMRKAADDGSKLEQYFRDRLMENGYDIHYHCKHLISNKNMHIDILIKNPRIAIEIDGPTHHTKIWNDELLTKNKEADTRKNGELLQQGISVIRVKYSKKNFSMTHNESLLKTLMESIEKIKNEKSPTLTNIG